MSPKADYCFLYESGRHERYFYSLIMSPDVNCPTLGLAFTVIEKNAKKMSLICQKRLTIVIASL